MGERGLVTIECAADIARRPEEVFDYVTDLANELEWNPRTRRVDKLTAGPVDLGTKYEAEWIKGNPMVVEYVRFDRPQRWASTGRSARLDAMAEGRVSATERGSHLVIRTQLRPKGSLAMVLPLIRRTMHNREQRNLHAIKATLESRAGATAPGVDLYWIPLGAGGHVVRWNGKVYEAIKAFMQHRPRRTLYHTALGITVSDDQFVIESAPIPNRPGRERGVVAEGPVGTRWAGRFRLFRYEIRRWRGGQIPDANEAVSSPVRVVNDLARATRILELVPSVPTPVWGRDELHTGDIWNSNSLTAWLLLSAGVDAERIQPPAGGRAPGWDAGVVVARREMARKPSLTERRQIAGQRSTDRSRLCARPRMGAHHP